MSEYRITFLRSARKELASLDKRTVSRILSKIESLSKQPYPLGNRKLEGTDDLWRIRVGDYRVVYRILHEQLVVEIVSVRHRRDAYRP
ncbi:MAG: type II toxin-antitoxin system RelE/ParE family toxin [Candidatus Promineofilum sp.]|jgi:mRNA interferase RelE/StbE|nr:type II toxin-antitoxin system RelE/ParE family toxin [Promineifilum sp.]